MTMHKLEVLGSSIAYRTAGDADASVALFLHGNPTSSYLWRNVIPHVAPVARCIAPDLIGFGRSGKPDIEYRFVDHVRYLDAFLEAAEIDSAYLVAQDWGTALAFELAARRPEFVRGLAFMEFILPVASWDEFHQTDEGRTTFKALRTPGVGERLVLEENAFIERLRGSLLRDLSEEEFAPYREPFPTPESRRPIWRFANELPIAGEPADVAALLGHAREHLLESRYAKLLFAGRPAGLIAPEQAERLARELHNCRFVQLSSGRHHLPEDQPDAIGLATAAWISQAEAERAGRPQAVAAR